MTKELFYACGIITECGLAAFIIRSFTSARRGGAGADVILNLVILAFSVAIVLLTAGETMTGRGHMILYLTLLIINTASFAAHEIAVLRRREMQAVLDEKARVDAELESYKLMYEKYEKTRILRHDLKEQISALKALIAEDRTEALAYADKLGKLGRELDMAEYTDNRVLNILLDRKLSECHEKGIELYIQSNGVRIGFLSEPDTVAIFSNLINNAMESCAVSLEKNIFIDFTTLNGAFTVIKIENNCDRPPAGESGAFATSKDDNDLHGVGLTSAKRAAEHYGGSLSADYDAKRRFFTAVVVFNAVR